MLKQFGTDLVLATTNQECNNDDDDDGKNGWSEIFEDVLQRSLLFGQIGKRLRFFTESHYALRHLYQNEAKDENNELKQLLLAQLTTASMIRTEAVYLLTKIKFNMNVFNRIVGNLMEKCCNMSKTIGDKRPFVNSQFHRDKHRIFVTIVLILAKIKQRQLQDKNWQVKQFEAFFNNLWDFCMTKVLPQEVFTSVRFLCQWSVVLLISIQPDIFCQKLIDAYDNVRFG